MRIRCEEPAMKSVDTNSGLFPWVPVEEFSDSVNIGEEELHKFLSMDEESYNFDVDMTHPEMNAPEIEVFITTQRAPLTSSQAVPNVSNVTSGFVSREDRPGRKGKKDGWRRQAAVLKAKCEVLRMEKEISKQRWEDGCVNMAEAARMALSLRMAVESILEPERRPGMFSAPCTPRRQERKVEHCQGLDERLQRLKISSAMRSKEVNYGVNKTLESRAESLYKRIGMLQQRSQFSGSNLSSPEESDSEIQQSDQQPIEQEATDASTYSPTSAKANDAVYRLLRQAEDGCLLEEEVAKQLQTKETVREILAQINAEAEQWIHVQGVLKNVSVEMAALQQACWKWEKRALDAECLATTRQREGEKWHVEVQTAHQKIEKLEAELTQLREINEGVKQRHALEQSRWLDIGSGHGATNNLGYTVIVQPIANTSSSGSCRCGGAMKDQVEGCKRSADLCSTSRTSLQGVRILEPSGLGRDVPIPSRLPSPRRPTPREVNEFTKLKQKPQNSNILPAPSNEAIKVTTGPKAVAPRSGKERSVSVERLNSRAPVRKASPTRSASIFTENQENLGMTINGGSSTKMFGTRGQSPQRRSGPSPAPGCRGPSPPGANFSVHQRGPLKDVNQVDPRMLRKSDFVKKLAPDT